MIEKASRLSRQWHEGQLDKAGKDYWAHPARVAANLQTLPDFFELSEAHQESATCAAYLHDVIEDCNVTPEELRNHGFSEDTIAAVLLVSKNHSYTGIEDYCVRISGHPIARAVKLADLSDNCNLQRQAELRTLGIAVDETKYPRVLAMLNPNEQEISWFQATIRIPVTALNGTSLSKTQ
jgi:(p)ppGpp synthase/HD superfamily hydrolase